MNDLAVTGIDQRLRVALAPIVEAPATLHAQLTAGDAVGECRDRLGVVAERCRQLLMNRLDQIETDQVHIFERPDRR